jgi:hypothetical protein
MFILLTIRTQIYHIKEHSSNTTIHKGRPSGDPYTKPTNTLIRNATTDLSPPSKKPSD